MNETGRDREALERRANNIRAHLMKTIDRLDERRRELVHPGAIVQRNALPAGLVGGAVALAWLSAWALSSVIKRSHEGVRRERGRALLRLWEHPERLARRKPERRSFAVELGRSVLLTLATHAAVRVVESVLQNPRGLPASRRDTPAR